ncbi:hypothetical protein [Streptomyces sp. NPDC058657]|uniref:hypothetical protein n=1 Tax=unclassified Streptomyces TaxID=2593676 RepID=UPI0036606D36
MRAALRSTLPRVQTAAWSHPYPVTPWSPVLYADGGEGDQGGKDDTDKGKGDDTDAKPDKGKSDSEVEKWKALARKHEERAKENAAAAKERDELKAATATESEKAVAEAVKKAVAEERSAGAAKLARQVFLAGAAGRLENPADVVEDVNLAKYIDANGDVDEDGLAKLIDRLAPKKSDTDDQGDGDGDQDGGRDTRRRTRGSGYQGTRRRAGGDSKGGGTLAEGAELYKSLLGGGDQKT